MVELELKLNARQNVVHIPRLLTNSMGRRFKIVPNSLAAILYPYDARLEDVLASLRVLIQDLELRTQREARANEARAKKTHNPILPCTDESKVKGEAR